MDITERKITKIAREAEKLVLRTLRETDVGTAEIDLIHALRHNPGCTQAALAKLPIQGSIGACRCAWLRHRMAEKTGEVMPRNSPSHLPSP